MTASAKKIVCIVGVLAAFLAAGEVWGDSLRLAPPRGVSGQEAPEDQAPVMQQDPGSRENAPESAAPAQEDPAQQQQEMEQNAPAQEQPGAQPGSQGPEGRDKEQGGEEKGGADPQAESAAPAPAEEQGEPLRLPEQEKDKPAEDAPAMAVPRDGGSMDFVKGQWTFDREFEDPAGNRVAMEFAFDEKGEGTSAVVDKQGHRYEAKAVAQLQDGTLCIATQKHTGPDEKTYAAQLILCMNDNGQFACEGTDGKNAWKGARLVAKSSRAGKEEPARQDAQSNGGQQPGAPVTEPAAAQDSRGGQAKADAPAPEREAQLVPDSGAEASIPAGAQPMAVPPAAADMGFVRGKWHFDRAFTDSEGRKLLAGFAFDGNGKGVATLTSDKGEVFEAEARAALDDGALKIRTGRFAGKDSPVVYAGMFSECRNVGGQALCAGTDGWRTWANQHLLADDLVAEENGRKAQAEAKASPQAPADPQPMPPGAQGDGSGLAELDDGGADMAPDLMRNAEKARAGKQAAASSLAGDWRFSRDFARKSDGSSVALEFHFDKNGKGHSVIREGAGKEFKASAQVTPAAGGAVRVKTEAYSDGSGKGYYPTFMECRPNAGGEFSCDVSNGWMRLEDGRLLSLASLERQQQGMQLEELLAVDPAPAPRQPAPAAEQAPQAGPSIEDLLAGMSDDAAKRQNNAPKPGNSLVLPEDDSSMDFLQGKWRCNTGLVRTSDNQPIVMEFSFDGNGRGTSSIVEQSGRRYTASARAKYKKGRLTLNTSEFYSRKSPGRYPRHFLECRQSGAHALCSGENAGIRWHGATFTRIK